MNEKPKKLEYSKYDAEITESDQAIKEIGDHIILKEREIDKIKLKIEEIKLDPTYDDAERAKAIADYEEIINIIVRAIKLLKENAALTHGLKYLDQYLKEQADKMLKRGEHLDSLTSDIEQEDEPPRSIN